MAKKMIAKLESLVEAIKEIANGTQYPFWNDNERITEIINLIWEYEDV